MCLCVVCFPQREINQQPPIQSWHQMFREHHEGFKKNYYKSLSLLLLYHYHYYYHYQLYYILLFLSFYHQYHDHVSLNCIQKSPAK